MAEKTVKILKVSLICTLDGIFILNQMLEKQFRY